MFGLRMPFVGLQAVIAMLLVTSSLLPANTFADDVNFFTLENLHERSMVLVVLTDSSTQIVGYGTGVLLYDYGQVDSLPPGMWLMTARHVLEGTAGARPVGFSPCRLKGNREFERVTDTILSLTSQNGQSRFYSYKQTDLSLVHIPANRITRKDLRPLARSQCSIGDEVLNGTSVLVFGLADFEKFAGLTAEQFLVTGGIIALQNQTSYMIDKLTFKGMSGGVVFKEVYGLIEEETDRITNGYQAIGIVSASVPATDNQYSWITKMEYVDSILVQLSGAAWGRK